MPEDFILDESLAELCDIVENALEGIVLQFRGQFFEEGMEEKLKIEFEMRLTANISKIGVDIDKLPESQKKIHWKKNPKSPGLVSQRIRVINI